MVNVKGKDYSGVWELDGKYFTLAGMTTIDWDIIHKGTELWNQDGRGYVEVEFIDPAPHWTEVKVRSTIEIRACIRQMLECNFKAIRMILFEDDDATYDSVKDICEFDDMKSMRKRYPYGTYIDYYVQQWSGKRMSLEGVKHDDWYNHE